MSASQASVVASAATTTGGVSVGSFDIMIPHSREAFQHPGNVIFRQLIRKRCLEYQQTPERRDRVAFVNKILLLIQRAGGRFLKNTNGVWRVLNRSQSSRKVHVALSHARGHNSLYDPHIHRVQSLFSGAQPPPSVEPVPRTHVQPLVEYMPSWQHTRDQQSMTQSHLSAHAVSQPGVSALESFANPNVKDNNSVRHMYIAIAGGSRPITDQCGTSTKETLPTLSSNKTLRNSTRVVATNPPLPSPLTDLTLEGDRMIPVIHQPDRDRLYLSPYQCLLRAQLCFIIAPAQLICKISTQGRQQPVIPGQVGIACRHCVSIIHLGGYSQGVYFPSALEHIYNASQNVAYKHFFINECPIIPDALLAELRMLKGQKVKRRRHGGLGVKGYWTLSAVEAGLVEREGRLFHSGKLPVVQVVGGTAVASTTKAGMAKMTDS